MLPGAIAGLSKQCLQSGVNQRINFLTLLQIAIDFVRIIIGKVNKVSCSATPPTLPRNFITCPTRLEFRPGGLIFFRAGVFSRNRKRKHFLCFRRKLRRSSADQRPRQKSVRRRNFFCDAAPVERARARNRAEAWAQRLIRF